MTQTNWTPAEIEIMTAALPVIDAVPLSQDECWPGDAGHEECSRTNHTASAAAVAATVGLVWEFYSWSATAAWMRKAIAA